MSRYHVPVMPDEVLEFLAPERGGTFVDGTLGGGGHARLVLDRLPAGSRLFGIDRDPAAIRRAAEWAQPYGEAFQAIHGNFSNMGRLLADCGVTAVHGILLDLGVSSHQLDEASRGFSYHEEAPLDMRMDTSAGITAADVVNGYSEKQLTRVIGAYGEERFAVRIAKHIVASREQEPIQTTTQLARIVKEAIPAAARRDGPHPARRTFQSLRIEVNGELDGLEQAVRDAHDLLAPGGRLVVITFHSLEDRIVKQSFKQFANPCTCDPKAPVCSCGKEPTVRILTAKPVIAGEEELKENSRARSAKLRAIRRL